MVEGTDGPEAEALAPERTGGRRRRALWGALAVLAIAAGGLAIVANDDDAPPRLPVALGATEAEGRSAAPTAAADMALYAPVHYIAGDDLPALGGSGPAHRLSGTVDEAAVRRLAAALDLIGTPVHEESSWRIASDDGFLEVYEGGGGSWWYSSQPQQIEPDRGGSVEGSEGCPPDAEDCASTSGAGSSGSSGSGSAGSTPSPVLDQPVSDCDAEKCVDPAEPEPEPFVPPADLPTKDEAKAIALALFADIGTDLGQGKVTVDGPYETWQVSIEPTVDGLPVSGLYLNASVGPKGEIVAAGGVLNVPERLGDYPTVDTREAIERLNDGSAYGGGRETMDVGDDTAVAEEPATSVQVDPATDPAVDPAVGVPAPGAACTSSGVAEDAVAGDDVARTEPAPATEPVPPTDLPSMPECPPYVPPEPVDVVLHQAERILVLVGANDGSTDAYLVPGYRMRGDDEMVVDVPAVDDDSLLPSPEAPAVDTPEAKLADE